MIRSFIKSHRLALTLLIILTLITYVNSFGNSFLSDDIAEIVNNPNIGNFSYAISSRPVGFIRPILYALAFNIGGLNPFFFRLINIFFHIGSVILVYAILQRLYSRQLAFITSAMFATLPAISEAVVWISGGSYPQYAFFFLLSFLLYLLASEKKSLIYFSWISYLLSFMSHPQMPMALFLIFPLWEFCFGDIRKNWKKSLPFFAIALAYLYHSFASLPQREYTLETVNYQTLGFDNIFLLIPVAVSSYLSLIFFPAGLTLYHSEESFNLLRAAVCIIFFLIIILSFKKNRFVFFWLTFFLIAIAPTLTPFRLNWVVAERYLYLPSLGILAVIGFFLDKLYHRPKFKNLAVTIFILILMIFSVRTIVRNIDWQNQDNLWMAAAKTSPSSPNNHNNLGDMYGRHGDKQAAIREFQEAIALKPDYGDAYHNLANTYAELGETDKALENYQKAIRYNPNLWQSYQNMAAIYFQQKQYDKAIENIQKAIEINPKDINLRLNLGIIYLASGNREKAKELFNLVLSADPQNQIAQNGLSEASK